MQCIKLYIYMQLLTLHNYHTNYYTLINIKLLYIALRSISF